MASRQFKIENFADSDLLAAELRVWEVVCSKNTEPLDAEQQDELFRSLFLCLGHEDQDIIELAASILTKFFRRVEPHVLLDNYQVQGAKE